MMLLRVTHSSPGTKNNTALPAVADGMGGWLAPHSCRYCGEHIATSLTLPLRKRPGAQVCGACAGGAACRHALPPLRCASTAAPASPHHGLRAFGDHKPPRLLPRSWPCGCASTCGPRSTRCCWMRPSTRPKPCASMCTRCDVVGSDFARKPPMWGCVRVLPAPRRRARRAVVHCGSLPRTAALLLTAA